MHLQKPSPDTMYAHEMSMASRLVNEPWEEGMEREVRSLNLSLSDLLKQPRLLEIEFPGERMMEESSDEFTRYNYSGAATIGRDRLNHSRTHKYRSFQTQSPHRK